ncbi:hemerythrin domain-containing protein [Pseudooceanicola sp. 216_PA32_1]|uniref:Hemerythrin domain-containing protein n=1 Tax=Pseudooceanicola pacificus TaxID=2676438 RepID=A0A844W261_9RHOB|nr:hemerythrin domain-containing protein [Pseudooceanicola pacificus]MWB77867.1 hemerythrin domain-containing protein [Pseudooceanicola pacificus]
MTSIYDAIRADHDRHRELLERIDDTSGDSAERKTAWRAFYQDVKSHSAAEEETFYSKLMQQTWGQDAARHSVHEHAEMDEIMEELRGMDMSSPGWIQRFRTLKHDYEHHMEEEENEVFARARKVIGAEKNESFGARFQTRKAQELELIEAKREDALED